MVIIGAVIEIHLIDMIVIRSDFGDPSAPKVASPVFMSMVTLN